MLSFEEMAILDFERASWLEPGPKDQAIEFSLGLSSAVYYEQLRGLVGKSAAATYDPLTTRRVLRMIDQVVDRELAG